MFNGAPSETKPSRDHKISPAIPSWQHLGYALATGTRYAFYRESEKEKMEKERRETCISHAGEVALLAAAHKRIMSVDLKPFQQAIDTWLKLCIKACNPN